MAKRAKRGKYVTINGQRVKLSYWRTSGKGAKVDAARVHVKGLGTVYIQVYEPGPKEVAEHIVAPTPPPEPPRHNPQRVSDQIDELIVETMRAMSQRLNKLEQRAIVLPEGTTIPNPRPTRDGN